jgi:hypothetical protein
VRTLIATGLSLAALAGSAPAAPILGRLSGATQISFGCPGPVREGEPGCNPWRPLAHARLTVAGNGIKRVVLSDERGRFTLVLPVGGYLVTPLPQKNTRGGPRLTVRVSAGKTTWIRVRFVGFPMMV